MKPVGWVDERWVKERREVRGNIPDFGVLGTGTGTGHRGV